MFPLASLESLGAFLAVRMNGESLPPDHGRPVRLAVPGWCGCSWIKWVDEIRLVDASEPATSQMREFAARTAPDRGPRAGEGLCAAGHPDGGDAGSRREASRRVRPRVPRRRHRLGRARAIDRLAIRFGDDEPWKPFDLCPAPRSAATWSLWTLPLEACRSGSVVSIALKVPDATVPQRRLDSGYYVRQVRIDEV